MTTLLTLTLSGRQLILTPEASDAIGMETPPEAIWVAANRIEDVEQDCAGIRDALHVIRRGIDWLQLPSMSVGDRITWSGQWGMFEHRCEMAGWTSHAVPAQFMGQVQR